MLEIDIFTFQLLIIISTGVVTIISMMLMSWRDEGFLSSTIVSIALIVTIATAIRLLAYISGWWK